MGAVSVVRAFRAMILEFQSLIRINLARNEDSKAVSVSRSVLSAGPPAGGRAAKTTTQRLNRNKAVYPIFVALFL